MENIKCNLKGVVGSSNYGLLLDDLESEYLKMTHSQLDYWSFGYVTAQSLLEDIPDVVEIVKRNSKLWVEMVVTKNDTRALKDLAVMITNTNSKKQKFSNWRKKEPQNRVIPNNVNKFTISVQNEYCRNSMPSVYKGFNTDMDNMYPSRMNKENNYGFETNGSTVSLNQDLSHNSKNNNTVQLLKSINSMSISNDQIRSSYTSHVTPRSKGQVTRNKGQVARNKGQFTYNNSQSVTQKNGEITPKNNSDVTPKNNGEVTPKNNVDVTPTNNGDVTPTNNGKVVPYNNGPVVPYNNGSVTSPTFLNNSVCTQTFQSEDCLEWGSWIIKPVIAFEILHKQVNVLGVQSGQAIVVGVNTSLTRDLLNSKNVSTFFPGDILLWQPPFNDPQRPKGFVDIQTAFPATIIKRSHATKVQVRILGLVTLIEVSISDVYEMPASSEILSKICRMVKSREITMATLAVIPKNIDIWDETVYTGIYNVLLSIDEGGLILERSIKKGHFLNIFILSYIQESLFIYFLNDAKVTFVKHLTSLLDRCVRAMSPTYEQLISGNDVYPEGIPLSLIYNEEECQNEMMIGRKGLANLDIKEHSLIQDKLFRLKYWDKKNTLYSVDDQSEDVPMPRQMPLRGIYIVNDKFISCPITKNDSLRFKTALLSSLPSIVDLHIKLGVHDV